MNETIFPPDHEERLRRARLAMDGLSVGDAFGQCFFGDSPVLLYRFQHRQPPPSPWTYTDDTVMALSVYRCLAECGRIDCDRLAELFASEYANCPWRGYGGTAHAILRAIGAGEPWKSAAGRAFSGMGSMGNGGAMRVAPLGAYYADDIDALIEAARASAMVTHAHPEGQAGAIAAALAAAWAWNHRAAAADASPDGVPELLEFVLQHTPKGDTHTGIRRALELPLTRPVNAAVGLLGNGCEITAPDTVPFSLWCAARHWQDFTLAMWTTASGSGDIDTTCAIVGGIVALSAGPVSIHPDWLAARGHLPLAD